VKGRTLTQDGPRLTASIAGQTLADLTLGQASVSAGDVDCASAGPGGASIPAAQLACTARSLALVDVTTRGGRTRFSGAADRRHAGRRVDVIAQWNGRVVARPIVQDDGSFAASAGLPPKALRRSNRARYQARIGNERSLGLKLFRRMLVDRMTSSDGMVRITGHVVGLARPVQAITIKRRVSCAREVTARTIKPDRTGHFSVTIPAPPTGQLAVYRLQTRVPSGLRGGRLFQTFTLPRAVELHR
jgi:hypothetical protein